MARVFLAEQRGAGGFLKRVVIKRIHEEHASDERFITMFVDEARILVNLKHANILEVLELEQEGRDLYMVLEYVDGPDLNTLFNNLVRAGERVPVPLGLFIVNQVLSGLVHAHAALAPDGEPLRLIHRDITPTNVILGRRGEVKLGDFGVARAEGRYTKTVAGEVKGKYSYMAPEVMKHEVYDQRSDVFSMGVLLWETLTTRPLFHGKSDFHVMDALLHAPVSPPSQVNPEVPPELDPVVFRALERDAALRTPSARDLKRALAPFLPPVDPDALSEQLAALVVAHGGPPVVVRSSTPPQDFPVPTRPPGLRPITKRFTPANFPPVQPVAGTWPPSSSSPGTPAEDAAPRLETPPTAAGAPPVGFAPTGVASSWPGTLPPAVPATSTLQPESANDPSFGSPSPWVGSAYDALTHTTRPSQGRMEAVPEVRPPPAQPFVVPAWVSPPAAGDPGFHAVMGPDRTVVGPMSAASAVTLLERADGLPSDKLGVSALALVPLSEVGRLLFMDHLVRPPSLRLAPSLSGTVSLLGEVKLLTTVVDKKMSGLLHLEGTAPTQWANAYVLEGCLQYCMAPEPKATLVATFLAASPQGAAGLPHVLTLVLRERLPLPRAMAKMGGLTGRQITTAVSAISRQRLAQALAWEGCRFSFFPGLQHPYELPPCHDLALAVLADAYPLLHPAEEVAGAAQRLLDTPLKLDAGVLKAVGDLGLPAEVQALKQCLLASPVLRPGWASAAPPGSDREARMALALVLLERCGVVDRA
jgi:serine/threonine protein kinase